jgi:isoquinoline 1-oxidoreductase alpha subunit
LAASLAHPLEEEAFVVGLTLNGTPTSLDVPPEMPLLWAIREHAGLTGTKFGCGIGACGACTVHLDGEPVRSCSLPAGAAAGRSVTTIEGLAGDGGLHPVQAAWIREQVPQCGYCQSGMIMAVAAMLRDNPPPCSGRTTRRSRGVARRPAPGAAAGAGCPARR